MQHVYFTAACPYEVGDLVQNAKTGAMHFITDIACIHYMCLSRPNKVEFRYELDNSGQYVRLEVQR